MAFVLLKDGIEKSTETFVSGWQRYREYLASISEKLPNSAREFALADWHYNFNDHRAPHDGWVNSVLIYESATGDRKQNRQIHIKISLLGAYHDGIIEIEYVNVANYKLGSSFSAHGDWLRDEIRLSEKGLVLHEIEIAGESWLIESEDIYYVWLSNG